MKKKIMQNGWQVCRLVILLVALCLGSCSDNDSGDDPSNMTFDPNKPIVVDGINPTTGGIGQRLVIMGDNFGNDPSMVNVTIGGQKSVIINVKSHAIYCLVPAGAYSGEINVEVSIGEESSFVAQVKEGLKFDYQRKMVVSTLLGSRRDDGGYDNDVNGPFDNCGAIASPAWMEFDPKYPHLIYVAQDADDAGDGGGNMRVIDLQNKYFGTAITDGNIHGNHRARSLNFFDENHMAVAVDQGDQLRAAVYGFSRTKEPPTGDDHDYQAWGRKVTLVNYRQCNTVAFHPVDHDMYFNSYENGQFFRVDHTQIQAIFDGTRTEPADKETLFEMDREWEYNIRIHPTGNYAYIVAMNQGYIQKTIYNWAAHRFMTPFVIAGTARTSGYEDAIGSNARFNRPYQGVFVKNPDYAGQEDEYDFVICDCLNQCIRLITPQGKVSTFAGRGSASLNGNPWGYVNGDLRQEARFDRPRGLAYDETSNSYYVGDGSNRRIRKMAMEEIEE